MTFGSRLLKAAFVLLMIPAFIAVSVAQDADTDSKSKDIFANLKFRNLGPAVAGGRVAAVAGVAGQPNIYYVGAAAGGVFKTADGGLTWKPVFEHENVASIGALAIAQSNPNVIYVGTGEAKPRNDISTGKGVYVSSDAGASWRHIGLENVGQISRVIVSPANPDVVYVAALGRVWGTNPDRGVFRTTNGGKSWDKVLYVDDKTGATDMVMQPGNPNVLFAAMWQVRRYPWMLDDGGPNSAIYRSVDGGTTWKRLTQDMPKGPLGKIGLAIAPSEPNHVYALIETKSGVLWDSRDLGDHWTKVTDNRMFNARPFYFSRLEVSPDNPSKIYFLSFDIVISEDGGKTGKRARGLHPDNHTIWIDPKNPERVIAGNDGGVYVSTDGGGNWRYLDNLPIEQYYMVATDDESPYLVCGGLQDNNGWCGPSNSLSRGGIIGADWWTVVGGDGEYVVPAGNKSHTIYADSQNGFIQRLDSENGMSSFIRPYLHGVGNMAPSDLKYRFNWTSPIAVAPHDPNTLYLGGNVLFKSSNGGKDWTPVSGDLTRNDKSKQVSSGGPIWFDLSGAETYDTILSMSLSPVDSNVIWVGTDDGLVQVTRDGGKTWTNATANLKGVPEWGRVQQIESSPFDAGTAYVAFDLHEIDNDKPYVYKTHDFGKTWTAIMKGLPETDPARVIRENPNKKGMLVLGTETGLFYSHDEGATWTALKSNFPTVPTYDIQFHKKQHDLLVATHGRGLFILDDITPLEETTPEVLASDFHVYSTAPATKWHMWNKRGFSQAGFVTPNPPSGGVITYYLKSEIEPTPEQKRKRQSPVKITITDESGNPVRTVYGPSKKGINRATWNLSYQEATRLNFVPERPENEFFDVAMGPPALPGTYKVNVTVNGKTETQTLAVSPDPRYPFDMDAAKATLKVALEVRDEVSALHEMLNRVESLKSQLATVQKLLATDDDASASAVAYKPVVEQARSLEKRLKGFEEGIYLTEAQPEGSDRLHFLSKLQDRLEGLLRSVQMSGYNNPPNPLVLEEMAALKGELQKTLGEFNAMVSGDVTNFNKLALEKGANTLYAGNAIELKGGAASSSAGK